MASDGQVDGGHEHESRAHGTTGRAATAGELGADLIVMSGRSRDNDGVAAVSATIQRVLDEADTTLVVVLVPEGDSGAGGADAH